MADPAQNAPADLCCPISLELFEDPISTPCCGQTLSRRSMQDHLAQDDTCPLCRQSMWDYPEFNANTVPRNRTIAGLVDSYRGGTGAAAFPATTSNIGVDGEVPGGQMEDVGPKFRCALTTCQAGGQALPVGRLQVDVEWPTYEGDVCLFIPVIDKSGSMGGQPFEQVKTALLHMLDQTLSNRSVFTCIIPYDSRAEMMKVPRDGGAETDRWRQMQARIRQMQAGGGTSFGNAFMKIREVLFGDTSGGKVTAQAFEPGTAEFEAQRALGRKGLLVQGAPAFVKSVCIVFMTDGQDNTRADRGSMVEQLRSILSQWTKHVVVHTVGFSRSHDFPFLDALRKVGRVEGTFRFADPSDGPDALCSKLAELTDSIVASTSLRLNIDPTPWRFWSRASTGDAADQQVVMRDGFGTLRKFVLIDQADLDGCPVRISVPGQKVKGEEVSCQVAAEFKGNVAWLEEWQAELVNEVVVEITALAKDSHAQSLAGKLHLAFLLQRSSFLEVCIKDEGKLRQLQLCTSQANALLGGSNVNIARLMDAQVGGTAQGGSTSPRTARVTVPAPARPSAGAPSTIRSSGCDGGRVASHGLFCVGRGGKSGLHVAVLHEPEDRIYEELQTADPFQVDDVGDSALAVACAVGRLNAVRMLLRKESLAAACLWRCNRYGESPLQLAALRGHWNTVRALLAAGAARDQSENNMERLLETVLSRGFHKTAATLVSEGLCTITLDTLRGRVPAGTLKWIMEEQEQAEYIHGAQVSPEKQQMYLRRGVENGMEDLVQRLLAQGVCPESADDFGELAEKASNLTEKSATNILELLLKSSKAVQEWSLGRVVVLAAAHGRLQHVELLLDHSGTSVNWQDSSGRTALHIACEQRHREIIVALLNRGANTAIADITGCTPLVASIRRNHCAAVAALLGAEAPVLRSSNELSALQVCCELGRPENLDMILKHVMREEGRARVLEEIANLGLLHLTIDSKQMECLKVLLVHGALEARYDPSLPPLHAAARVGCSAAARLLVEAGACVSLRDGQGRTALHIAVQHGQALVVRLLRALGVDSEIVDDSGCVAVSYCDGASEAAKSIRAELVDPACEHLMAVACGTDSGCRGMLRFAGLPGLLPSRRCLDIHSGDKWTPLMQAVVCNSEEFACSLVESNADVHRVDRHGLSALFWAKALRGHDWVVKLTPQQRQEKQGIAVQCKDGELRVSSEASAWMETNFPLVAALAVPRAVLETTLKTRNFEILMDAHAETEGPFDEQESNALAALVATRRADVRESLVFQCAASADAASFHQDALGVVAARQARRHRLQLEVQVLPTEVSKQRVDDLLLAGDLKVSMVDFLRREKLVDKARLERCALASVATVASPFGRGALSLQQSLLVHACVQEPDFLRGVSDAFGDGKTAMPQRPLAKALLLALQSLPCESATVYKLLPGCEYTFEQGQLLGLAGVVFASSFCDAMANRVESISSGTVVCIRARSARSWDSLQGSPSQERAILPDAVFKVATNDVSEALPGELAGWNFITLEEVE